MWLSLLCYIGLFATVQVFDDPAVGWLVFFCGAVLFHQWSKGHFEGNEAQNLLDRFRLPSFGKVRESRESRRWREGVISSLTSPPRVQNPPPDSTTD